MQPEDKNISYVTRVTFRRDPYTQLLVAMAAGVWFRKCLRLHDNEALVKAGLLGAFSGEMARR